MSNQLRFKWYRSGPSPLQKAEVNHRLMCNKVFAGNEDDWDYYFVFEILPPVNLVEAFIDTVKLRLKYDDGPFCHFIQVFGR